MHYLLTNDDGIDAPGLHALEMAVRGLPKVTAVTVVAPSREHSQCGHRVTTGEALAVQQIAGGRYCVDGTPADCVRLAIFALGIKPDYVVSGVNPGGNMGQDLYISGTVAGAREATFHGVKAAALSHYIIRDLAMDWERISAWSREVLLELLTHKLKDGEFWNVNFPHLPAGSLPLPKRVECQPCRAPLNVAYLSETTDDGRSTHKYSATYASRPVEADSDVAVCFGGQVAVSKVRV